MGMSGSGLLALLVQKMGYLNQRQSVLAENVANSNSPGYQAKDLVPFTFDSALKGAQFSMQTDDARHIVPASMSGVNAATTKAQSFETLPSGNSVDLEQQMMQVSENSVNYQLVTDVYKHIGSWFRIAVKGS